jgi:hypothetical protein
MKMEEDLVWIQANLVQPLMYNISVVKTSYDRGSILKWFFKKPRMMVNIKYMEKIP